KATDAEKAARAQAMEAATLYATEVPLRTMETASRAFEVIRAMAQDGNPASVSDAGVGALAARAAVRGAFLNVKINAAGLADKEAARALIERGAQIEAEAEAAEAAIIEIVNAKIG
ncbi:MAG: cyclodeaminase/cyclohydrolase family protein, partial [Muribaculaceae bacterium]